MSALSEILSLISEETRVIAIDGRSASGKTTLSSLLAAEIEGSVIHMDDFFLPPDLRSELRYSEAGGNVHYERFIDEVVDNLRLGHPFSYRRFSCSEMDYDPVPVFIDTAKPVIVEGAYSLSPRFGKYYDLSVFLTIGKEEQMRRICLRNGKDKAKVFETRWIPLEEAYFKAYSIEKRAALACCQE